jgi:hypothetical protein
MLQMVGFSVVDYNHFDFNLLDGTNIFSIYISFGWTLVPLVIMNNHMYRSIHLL